MEYRNLLEEYGLIKTRIKFPIYDEYSTITGTKSVTENLGYVKGGASDTAKIIINAIASLYDTYELDANNTTISYKMSLKDFITEQAITEEEITIITPAGTMWQITLQNVDQLGNESKSNIGYISGDLTPNKARIFDRLSRALTNLSTNTYKDTLTEAIFKPYKEG